VRPSLRSQEVGKLLRGRDAWWTAVVVDAFDFLKECGYGPPDVRFHHEGHWVRYSGRDKDLIIEHEPGSAIEGMLVSRSLPMPQSLSHLLEARFPGELPEPGTDRAAIERTIRAWAALLKRCTPDLM
jgi:hypothetical protein